MEICNTSGGGKKRDYSARTLRGRSTEALNNRTTQRETEIAQYPSLSRHVWYLVTHALLKMGYGDK